MFQIHFWDQSHVTIVWNTRETGDIHSRPGFGPIIRKNLKFEQQNWNNIKLTQWGSKNWPFEIRKHLKIGLFYCPVFWMVKRKRWPIYFDPQQKGQRLLKPINDMLYVVGNVSWTCQPQKFSKSEFKSVLILYLAIQ